jgi:hypothetical protein
MERDDSNVRRKYLYFIGFFSLAILIWGWVLCTKLKETSDIPFEKNNLIITTFVWTILFVHVIVASFINYRFYINEHMILFSIILVTLLVVVLIYSTRMIQDINGLDEVPEYLKKYYAFAIASIIVASLILVILLGILLFVAYRLMKFKDNIEMELMMRERASKIRQISNKDEEKKVEEPRRPVRAVPPPRPVDETVEIKMPEEETETVCYVRPKSPKKRKATIKILSVI